MEGDPAKDWVVPFSFPRSESLGTCSVFAKGYFPHETGTTEYEAVEAILIPRRRALSERACDGVCTVEI